MKKKKIHKPLSDGFLNLLVIIVVLSFLSFRYIVEQLLYPIVGLGWAYVIDQGVIVISGLIALALLFYNAMQRAHWGKILREHWGIGVTIAIAFLTHVLTMHYYFWSDEVVWLLKPITQNSPPFFFHGDIFKGYFILSYALLFLLFGVKNYWIYTLASILYFCLVVGVTYIFIYVLSRNKLLAFLTSAFVATTPAFLDMFTWHSTGHAPVVAAVVGSMTFLMLYLQKKDRRFYFASLILFFIATKIGFLRIAPFLLIPIFLVFFSPSQWKRRETFRQNLIISFPYILISFCFFIFNFFYPELSKMIYDIFHHATSEAGSVAFSYRGLATPQTILPKLYYFLLFLFVPAGLLGDLFGITGLNRNDRDVSIVLTLGFLALLFLLSIFVLAFFKRKQFLWWLVLFSVFFLLVNLLHIAFGYAGVEFKSVGGYSPLRLDIRFTNEGIGYGPGSRYVFLSSIGFSLLFGLLSLLIIRSRSKYISVAGSILAALILLINSYYTIRAQVLTSKNIGAYAYLPKQIFMHLPRDGQPKLVYSVNQQKNDIDTKFGGWHWFLGFYKEKEFSYTKSAEDALHFLTTTKKSGRLFAFYTNPGTLSFADISEAAVKELISPAQSFSLLNGMKAASSVTTHIPGHTAFTRPIVNLNVGKKRLILPRTLTFSVSLTRDQDMPFPLVNTFPENSPMPLQLFDDLPQGTTTINGEMPSFPGYIDGTIDSLPQQKRTLLEEVIVKRREEKVSRSLITDTKILPTQDLNVLSDNIYTAFPQPITEESFVTLASLPASLTISHDAPILLGRILLNTPHIYSSAVPTKIKVEISDGGEFHEVPFLIDTNVASQSKNHGYLTALVLNNISAKDIRLTIEQTTQQQNPVFDEISLDSAQDMSFSPQELNDFLDYEAMFIPSTTSVDALTKIVAPYGLSVFYACAENDDWEKQLHQPIKVTSGVWHKYLLPLSPYDTHIERSMPLDCQGTLLQRIVFIGPPYPSTLSVSHVQLLPEKHPGGSQ